VVAADRVKLLERVYAGGEWGNTPPCKCSLSSSSSGKSASILSMVGRSVGSCSQHAASSALISAGLFLDQGLGFGL
jgi:hypothetical protein